MVGQSSMRPRNTQKVMRTVALHICLLLSTVIFSPVTVQSDPDPLQDYCVAARRSPVYLNGAPCLDPDRVTASHFTTSALSSPGNTSANRFGFNVTLTTLAKLPGVNTLGLVMARVDIAPNGVVPLHAHPRASEVTLCLSGAVLVGFVDTSGRLFTQQLRPGDAFVFPRGLIHFLNNIDSLTPALLLSGLASQNPGVQIVAGASFTSKPPLPETVLKKSFQIAADEVAMIRNNLGG